MPKAPRVIQTSAASPYVVTEDDHDGILEIIGTPVVLPLGLPLGFYTTFVNKRGGTIQILVQSGNLFSPLAGTTLTLQYQQATVYRSDSGWIAPTL